MPGLGFDLAEILDAFRSMCRRSSGFDFVAGHELRKPPAQKFALGAWLSDMETLPGRSGLDSTSLVIELQARIYVPLQGDPDNIDTECARRVDLIWSALHSPVLIAGHEFDVLGISGKRFRAPTGWLQLPDNTPVRVHDLFAPLIIDDAYPQERE
jgi:hypothetical protein